MSNYHDAVEQFIICARARARDAANRIMPEYARRAATPMRVVA